MLDANGVPRPALQSACHTSTRSGRYGLISRSSGRYEQSMGVAVTVSVVEMMAVPMCVPVACLAAVVRLTLAPACLHIVPRCRLAAVRVPMAPRALPVAVRFGGGGLGGRTMVVAGERARRDRERPGVHDRLATIHQQVEGRREEADSDGAILWTGRGEIALAERARHLEHGAAGVATKIVLGHGRSWAAR